MDPIYLWRGFRHEWLREVLGFRLPHRISRLHSFIDDEGAFRFAQSTGVDGNYMRPRGRWTALRESGLAVERRDLSLRWHDEVDGPVPEARVALREPVRFALPEGAGAFAVLLHGFRLDTRCCDAHQPADRPCNSNGFWPVELGLRVGEGRREGSEVVCELEVELARGWTPTRGGVPFIEEKPLNVRLDYALEVGVTLLSGPAGQLRATRARSEVFGSARAPTRVTPVERPADGERPLATGLTGFRFAFEAPGSAPWLRRRGRYLTTLDFGVDAPRAGEGGATVAHRAGVWIPRSVVGTDLRAEVESALLELGPGAEVAHGETEGSLCIHSSDQAPFFSHWKKTGPRVGPVQSVDRVAI